MSATAIPTFMLRPDLPLDVFRALFALAQRNSRVGFSFRWLKDGSETFKPLTNATVETVLSQPLLPEILKWGEAHEHTTYFHPNTFSDGIAVRPFDGKPTFYQAFKLRLADLTAVFVDLDVGRGDSTENLTAGQALGILCSFGWDEKMPMPSIVGMSGRGAYVLWLLRDDATGRAPRATPENILQWEAVGHGLVARLGELYSDPDGTRVAQMLKAPGALDTLRVEGRETKTGRLCGYQIFHREGDGQVPRYTLAELMNAFGVYVAPLPERLALPPMPRHPAYKGGRGPGAMPPAAVPSHRRLVDIQKLSARRGGMRKGCRGRTLFHYFMAVFRYNFIAHRDQDAAKRAASEALWKLNRTFAPPLGAAEVKAAMRPKLRATQARNEIVARDLKVTAEEADELDLHFAPPVVVASRTRVKADGRERKEAERAEVDRLLLAGAGPTAIARRIGNGWTRQAVDYRRKALEKSGCIPVSGALAA